LFQENVPIIFDNIFLPARTLTGISVATARGGSPEQGIENSTQDLISIGFRSGLEAAASFRLIPPWKVLFASTISQQQPRPTSKHPTIIVICTSLCSASAGGNLCIASVESQKKCAA